MKGIAKFVLGGLVGAALGYLASQRRLRLQTASAPSPMPQAPSAPAEKVYEEAVQPDAGVAVEATAELVAEPAVSISEESIASQEVRVGEPLVEEILAAEPGAEEILAAEPVAEEALAAEPAAEDVAAAEPAPETRVTPLDELKARIEETRRRIREELEQPFFIAGLSERQAPAGEPETGEVSKASDRLTDYESVKRRIEAARVRLKAKAFDAMVTGETPLLARDDGAIRDRTSPKVAVDAEVEATIENALKQEES
ncbi:MAG: hypothetical protein N3B14_03065 [Thermoleophilia bacterium]|nr:hypothetical protein [Thermoleophilia bacterium]